ncbi:dTMP kinase [Mycoplasma sp. Mirounga ES2805-ORL]|uniref:dTMP kinase n=1 Tax=Mycoplasma sp. Mirounga ES2805-ORL TaxID=754514 RepID=UPI00197C1293|nr:dTMP kinase [Mycoplasma sp. Mirounga ES2805-ORL]QSF13395.1 dTMP kinase [Mycoplasma sp. Mirounga ES2805-ORL]
MFITFEGPDASGKTTIINKLIEKIKKIKPDFQYILTREPGGKNIKEAEQIREIIVNPSSNLSNIAEALLFTTSRRIHLERVIWPSLKEGKTVICDRYFDSFYAYQGFARGLGLDYVKKLTEMVIENTIPDITIFFDIKPEESKIRRTKFRLVEDRLDSETDKFHNSVYEGYWKLIKADPKRFIVVDASKSIDEVLEETYIKLIENNKFKKVLGI